MITAVLLSSQGEWIGRLRTVLRKHAAVLELSPEMVPTMALGSLPMDLVVIEAEYLTDAISAAVAQLKAAHPESVTVCVSAEDAAEQAQADGTLAPDFWIIVPATDLQLRSQIEMVVTFADSARQRTTMPSSSQSSGAFSAGPASLAPPSAAHVSRPESALYRMIGRMTGSVDTDYLLSTYCDAVHEMTQCVSYCLLWQHPGDSEFRMTRSQGLSPMVQELCRLAPSDPLPVWLQRGRGIISRDALVELGDGGPVLRELDMCGGVLAVPLFCEGVLRGIMAVGPKAIGTPYLVSEAEALFVLSANMATAVRQAELHQELQSRNRYIDQVLSSMESGLVTIGADKKILVCNPYAARVLRLTRENLVGSELRSLPAPLGDYLYSCLAYDDERSREVLSVWGGQVTLRVATRRLTDHAGAVMGSMMLLEDITAERELADERRNVERNEIIHQVVARFAHELKNPLATIHTFAELLPTRVDDPEFQQYWSDYVRRDVHRLDDLVAKLVSLSEQPASNRQVVGLPELVRLAVARLALLDDAAPSFVVSTLEDNLPPVHVDTSVMAAALSHLLRHGLGRRRKPVVVNAEVSGDPDGTQPIAIYVRASDENADVDEPQRLLDPSYVLDHPDIDLGPSASQRLIESQGGVLEAYHDGGDIVFRISLSQAPARADRGPDGEDNTFRLNSPGARAQE
jgi:nitrogen-specific signal transduction histidine kinase